MYHGLCIYLCQTARCSNYDLQEIKRLEEENQKLKERLATVQTKATSALTEKDKLKSDLAAASSATSRDSAVSVESSASTEELSTLQAKIEELQSQLSEVYCNGDHSAHHTALFTRSSYVLFLISVQITGK